MRRSLICIFALLVAVITFFCGCADENTLLNENDTQKTDMISEPSSTDVVNEEEAPQQPHSEHSFDDMLTFIESVDQNTFEEGNFKNVIEMIRDDGYILKPYFGGAPATIAVRNEEQTLHLAPSYNGLSEELFAWYRNTVDGKEYYFYVGVNYIDEQYLDEYEAHGSGGAYYAQGEDYEEKVNTELFKSARDYVKIQTCGEERNVILIKEEKDGYGAAEFQYDDFGIYVRFYVADGGVSLDEAREILNKLSFEKVYLNE